MNTANPFQIPSCLQADLQRRRQARFKKIVVASVIAGASGLVALLIAGCMSQQSQASAPAAPVVAPVKPAKMAAVSPQPAPALALTPVVALTAQPGVSIAPEQSEPQVAEALPTVYVVRPGDTLTRIAHLYKTTIQELKQANGLQSDKIVAGATLKLPQA